MQYIALMVNTKAANGKATKMASSLAASLYKKQISHQLLSDWPNDLSAFSEAWIIGGDGTVNHFINQYPGIQIPLAIFPGGTGNDVRWKLYGDITAEEQVEMLLSNNCKVTPIDAGTCNGKLFINGVGIGFDGSVLRSMSFIRRLGGHLGYLLVVISKIFSYSEPEFELEVDGKNIGRIKLLLLQIFNSSRTGGGFMVSPAAKIDDGRLNLLTCDNLPWYKRLLFLPSVEKGTHTSESFIKYQTVEQIKIEASKVVYAQIDGELFSSKKFSISILPKHFVFKVPAEDFKSLPVDK